MEAMVTQRKTQELARLDHTTTAMTHRIEQESTMRQAQIDQAANVAEQRSKQYELQRTMHEKVQETMSKSGYGYGGFGGGFGKIKGKGKGKGKGGGKGAWSGSAAKPASAIKPNPAAARPSTPVALQKPAVTKIGRAHV